VILVRYFLNHEDFIVMKFEFKEENLRFFFETFLYYECLVCEDFE